MKMAQIFPENSYKLKALSYQEIVKACENSTTVTGRVVKILSEFKELLVAFDDVKSIDELNCSTICGYLPFDQVSIYPDKYSKDPNRKSPITVGILLGKKVRVKITEVTVNRITLSRKKNMEEAYEHLCGCTSTNFYVTSLTTYNAFGDIGEGITARLNIKEATKARIKNIAEIVRPKDVIRVSLLKHNSEKCFEVSYKQLFKEFNPNDYFKGMAVRGVVNEPTNMSYTAFYISLTPQVSGILDVTSWMPELRYGDTVECSVSRVTERGLNLTFLKLIE